MSASVFQPIEPRAACVGGVGAPVAEVHPLDAPPPRRRWPMRPASSVEWRAVSERYGDLAYAVARKFRLQGQDAAEVFQNTWLVVLEKEEVPEEAGMARWLAAIASWESRKILRRRRMLDLADTAADTIADPDEPDPEDVVLQAEEEQALREALASLERRDRDLIVALFLSDTPLPYDVVARRCGIAVGSVGPLRARALEKLRAALEKAGVGARELAAAGADSRLEGWYP